MNFSEIFESMILDSHICDTEMAKCDIFAESSFREFHINCMESELKVLKESGTDDDYRFLVEAAEDTLYERIKKALKKAIEALKTHINRMVEKLQNTVASTKAKQALNKLKDLVAKFPEIKKQRIEINDLNKEFSCVDRGIHKLNAKLAKMKAGKTGERDTEDINEIIETTEKERKDIANKTTEVDISVDKAISEFENLVKSADNGSAVKEAEKAAKDAEKDIESGNSTDDSVLRNIYKICNAKIVLAKSKFSSLINTIMVLWAKLKSKITSFKPGNSEDKNTSDNDTSTNESTSLFDSDDYLGDTVYSEVFGEAITESDDGSYSNTPTMSSNFSDLTLNNDDYSSLFNRMEIELFNANEAYFGKSDALINAEKILGALLPVIRENPLGDYTNHPLTRALSNTLKKQFGFKEIYIIWKRSSKASPMLNTLFSSDLIVNGRTIIGIDKKKGYYDKEHSHVAYINLSSTAVVQANLTAGEYLAIILHELGHNFDCSIFTMIQTIFNILSQTFFTIPIPNRDDNSVELYSGIDLMPFIRSTGPGKSLYKTIASVVEKLLDSFPIFKKIANLGRNLGDWFYRIYSVYGSPVRLLSLPNFILLSPSAHLTGLFTKKGETFADSFAAAYGYSSELISALSKMQLSPYIKSDNGSVKDAVMDLNDHPVRKFFTDLSLAESELISLLINGTHGTNMNRAKINLDMLKKDLQNGDFTPEVRASLQTEIDKLTKTIDEYNSMTFDNERANLPFTLFARQLVYNAFHGRSDYIAKIFPDNLVAQESISDNDDFINSDVHLLSAVSENVDEVFDSIISDLDND